MAFVHQEREFQNLLGIVARETGITAALIEKDYWVTHTLWALHETGLEIWFKGGTSLSKGFKLIQRFSEDLDLMILHGAVRVLPEVTNWTSTNKGPTRQRAAFYDALTDVLAIPDVRVARDAERIDKQARSADYLGHYPGALLDQLHPAMSPFVRLEVGRARVVPHVARPLSSFVHDYLAANRMLAEFEDNRPASVRCVHPLVTLFDKLDAMARRYARDVIDADAFVRHYEDAAQIVRAAEELPDAGMTAAELAQDMLREGDITTVPTSDEPALSLLDTGKRAAVEAAYERVAPMFWGRRIALDDACAVVRDWLAEIDRG
jgi:predicted nucleotidyltransferase component of viral defense system